MRPLPLAPVVFPYMVRTNWWWRKLRRGRVEVYASDGQSHIHIKARAGRASSMLQAVKPFLTSLPEFPEQRQRLYRAGAARGAEAGDEELDEGQLRMRERS